MDFKKDFPIFRNAPHNWSYLDSGATTQKPKVVIDAVRRFYESGNANVHRSDYLLAKKATEAYEEVRQKVADLIHANTDEIYFTKNTNEAMNIVVKNCSKFLSENSVVVLSELEHNANVVPWLELQKKINFTIHWIGFDENFQLNYKSIPVDILERIRVVSLTHVSNVTGTVVPLKDVFEYFRKNAKKYVICVGDGAQAIGHMPVNVQDLKCDYYAFSAHKMYAPSGVGVLYAIKDEQFPLEPIVYGSHMIADIKGSQLVFSDLPDRIEAGTPNLEGVYGLGVAIEYLQSFYWEEIQNHERDIVAYALDKFKELKCVVFGSKQTVNRTGVFSFYYQKVHAHDVAQALDLANVCVRSGHHCAMVTMQALGVEAVSRASIGIYTTKKDIDNLIEGLKDVEKFYRV